MAPKAATKKLQPTKGKGKAINTKTTKAMKGGSMCPMVNNQLGGNMTDSDTIEIKKQMSLQTILIGALLFICIFAGGFMLAQYLNAPKTSTNIRVVTAEGPQLAATELIGVPTEQVVPPVYPSKLPEYPLRHDPLRRPMPSVSVQRDGNAGFQQMGVLVQSENDTSERLFLPLFGRKLNNHDRWEYYCASDKFHMMRLPIRYNNRECQDDVGCEEIYNGQTVMVPDYGDKAFVARIYKYNVPRY